MSLARLMISILKLLSGCDKMEAIELLMQEMVEYARNHHVPIIGQAGAALLLEVVRHKQPLFVLEIGTAIGYSAIFIAAHAPAARVITIEQDIERITVAQNFITRAGLAARVSILDGDAGEVLPNIDGRFDLVFIDAAKGQYFDYLTKVMGKLAAGAVIVADNVLFRGMVEGTVAVPRRYRTIVKRLQQYLNFVTQDPRFETRVYHDGDGLAISYYKGDVDA